MVPKWLSTAVDWWGKWGIRLAAGSSLLLHIFVLLLANVRRSNNACPVWYLFLWAAYQLLDMVGGYALGHLTLNGGGGGGGDAAAKTQSEQLLVAFWAPFLLLHLGGPDNLGAYSLDDDKLGWRKAFGGVSKAFSALFTVLMNIWLADNVGLLLPASIIMFSVGFFRFFENVWVMLRALRKQDKAPPSSHSHSDSDSHSHQAPIHNRPSNDSLGDASQRRGHRDRSIFSGTWEKLLEKANKEADKIYDKLYTKAGEVHTWHGYLLRLLSPVATATAFILFGLYPKKGLQQVDIDITYALLSMALLLDLWWLLQALASPYALAYVNATPGIWLRHEILCRGWWERLNRFAQLVDLGRHFGMDPSTSTYGYRSCSAFIGRRDLPLECTLAPPGCMARLWASIFGEGKNAVWSEFRAWRSSDELPEQLRNLLFERIKERFEEGAPGAYDMKHVRALWGQEAVRRRKETLFRDMKLDLAVRRRKHVRALWGQEEKETLFRGIKPQEDLLFGSVFQEDILLWHIATTIYLYSNNQQQHIRRRAKEGDVTTGARVGVIEAVSEYLMFLAAARPHMLPDPPLPGLYEVTQRALQQVYRNDDKKKDKDKQKQANGEHLWRRCPASAKEKLADMLLGCSDDLRSDANTVLISCAARLARKLRKAQDASQLEDVVNLVFDVWVDKLLYAGIQCSRESHARQLGKGGELVTIAWITAEYAGVFEIGETGKATAEWPDDSNKYDSPGKDNIDRPECPGKDKEETCHCHQDPSGAVCPHTGCLQHFHYWTHDCYC